MNEPPRQPVEEIIVPEDAASLRLDRFLSLVFSDFSRSFLQRAIGEAKGEATRTSHMIKVVKALVMKKHGDMSAAKAEVEALASPEYRQALDEDAAATTHYETLRALREAAALKIETWRSEQANYRAMKI